ncbi:MAG: DUF975 family protein [Chitinophagaceae bacterium]|nr:DUF975 family protein [Chitinophagaceae bacterium]
MNYTEIKDEALAKLNNNWGTAILALLIVIAISMASSFIPFASILISGPFSLGMAGIYLKISRGWKPDINGVFDGFKQFGNAIGASILIGLIVLLGCLLLIVPGIIAALALSQTYRIMHDNPQMSITDAMQKSHDMMKGHRGDYFIFNLSFIGWALLCILTLGLGFLILGPYVATSNSIYYNKLSGYMNQDIEQIGTELVN